jgi:hypothetical protein
MFVVLWEYEVKPRREPEFEKVYGPEVTRTRCLAATRTVWHLICSATRREHAFTSRRTIGIPVSLTKNFCKRGETTITH